MIAWFDLRERHHRRIARFMTGFQGQLISTWPVLTEVCHLLPAHLVVPCLKWVAAGGIGVHDLPTHAAADLAAMMEQYADLPMDLADASLVWLAAAAGIAEDDARREGFRDLSADGR